jgi:hypothetical protein
MIGLAPNVPIRTPAIPHAAERLNFLANTPQGFEAKHELTGDRRVGLSYFQ